MTIHTETTAEALLRRMNLARSILAGAPPGSPALHMALKALDGSPLPELAMDKRWHETAAQNGGSCEGCLIAWGDGWHAGFTEGQRQCSATHEGA